MANKLYDKILDLGAKFLTGTAGGTAVPERQRVRAPSANTASAAGAAPKVKPGGEGEHYRRMREYYDQTWADEVKANAAALQSEREQALADNAAQVEALNAAYERTNRQLFRDYMERARKLPQQLSAQGYSGGLTESGMLRLANSYGESLNENERARHAEKADFDRALARQLFEAQERADQADRQAARERLQNLAALRQAAYRDQQQRAKTMAAAGDFSEYPALGFSTSEVRYLQDMWRRMHPKLG